MNERLTIEIAMFRLKDGADEAALLAAADAMLPDLKAVDGFVRRELIKNENGQWIDILHWSSLAAAQRAAELIMTWPSAQPFIALMDESSVSMQHFEHVRTYG